MLTASFDEQLGLVRTISKGFHDQPEFERYFIELPIAVRQARMRTGHVLHLVDAVDILVQDSTGSAATMRESASGKIKIDHTAIVMTSALAKIQAQRLYAAMPIRFFSNMNEAIDWLQSFRPLAKVS